MFNEVTQECDWEDKVDCKGREKLIGSFFFFSKRLINL